MEDTLDVTNDNYATAETHRYFQDFIDQGAANRFVHEKDIAVALDKQTVIRSNIDLFYSHAIVDISQGATLTLPKSDGRLRLAQVIDSNHYTSDIFYDAGMYDLISNSETQFVYVFMRTSADPSSAEDQAKAHVIMEAASITSVGSQAFHSKWDPDEVLRMRSDVLSNASYTDSVGAFGDVHEIRDFEKFTFAAAYGWGGLPEAHAFYWVIDPALGDECATMTIDPPPVDRYWSLTVYDRNGWLAHPHPVRNSFNTMPNEDGSLTFHFGCGGEALNNIEITDNWTLVLRFYGPQKPIIDGTYSKVVPQLSE